MREINFEFSQQFSFLRQDNNFLNKIICDNICDNK